LQTILQEILIIGQKFGLTAKLTQYIHKQESFYVLKVIPPNWKNNKVSKNRAPSMVIQVKVDEQTPIQKVLVFNKPIETPENFFETKLKKKKK
jgi:hypothetical protein